MHLDELTVRIGIMLSSAGQDDRTVSTTGGFDRTELIAWLALALGAATGLAQLIGAYRRRKRVVVTASSLVQSEGHSSGGIYNRQIVVVTVHNIGANQGIDHVNFEWTPPPVSWGVAPAPIFGIPGTAKLPDMTDVLGVRGVLQDGEIGRWQFRVTAPQSNVGIGAGVDETLKGRAVVRLTSGKLIRSDVFHLSPDYLIPSGASLDLPISQWAVTSTSSTTG